MVSTELVASSAANAFGSKFQGVSLAKSIGAQQGVHRTAGRPRVFRFVSELWQISVSELCSHQPPVTPNRWAFASTIIEENNHE
jgi:hypothetical protein